MNATRAGAFFHRRLELQGEQPLLARDAAEDLEGDVRLGAHGLEHGLAREDPERGRLNGDRGRVVRESVEARGLAEQSAGLDDRQHVLAPVVVPEEQADAPGDELVEPGGDLSLLVDEGALGVAAQRGQVAAQLREPALRSHDRGARIADGTGIRGLSSHVPPGGVAPWTAGSRASL